MGGTGGTSGGTGGTTGGTTGTDPVKSDGCGKATTAKTGSGQTISINGSNRTYNLKLPDNYDMNKAYRLMVAYHWMNGTANNVTSENYYGLWSLSQNSTVFVAPQGNDNGWSNSGGADVEFSRQLIAQLESSALHRQVAHLLRGLQHGWLHVLCHGQRRGRAHPRRCGPLGWQP